MHCRKKSKNCKCSESGKKLAAICVTTFSTQNVLWGYSEYSVISTGILSTLQLDETATTETDVNGECATEIIKTDGKFVKSKSLSDCTKRAKSDIGIDSSALNEDLKPYINSL